MAKKEFNNNAESSGANSLTQKGQQGFLFANAVANQSVATESLSRVELNGGRSQRSATNGHNNVLVKKHTAASRQNQPGGMMTDSSEQQLSIPDESLFGPLVELASAAGVPGEWSLNIEPSRNGQANDSKLSTSDSTSDSLDQQIVVSENIKRDALGQFSDSRTEVGFKLGGSSSSLTIRALNRDNHKEATKLVDLFRRHYGPYHPYARVYETAFWCSSRQSKLEPGGLISIVAEQDNKFIAHLAIDLNRRANSAQILLPAIDPSLRKELFSIVRAFWRVIEEQGRRQKWGIVFEYNLSSQPLLQMLAAKCFRSETTALIPCPQISFGYDSHQVDNLDSGSCIQVMATVLRVNTESRNSIYVPDIHRQKVEELYAAAGIARQIISSASNSNRKQLGNTRSAIRVRSLKRLGIYQIRISPSDLQSWEDCFKLLNNVEGRREETNQRPSVQINLSDPLCAEFCLELERHNFRFCGILPMMAKSDYIVYSRYSNSELEQLTLYSAVARSLRDYMLEHTAAV